MIYKYLWSSWLSSKPLWDQEDYSLRKHTAPCSVPIDLTKRGLFSNPELPFYLRLTTDTGMARELAAMYCEKKTIKVYGVDRLPEFLTTSFIIPGFIPLDHLRNLTLIMWPPYWDLPAFSASISANYRDIASSSWQQLEQLLQIKHKRGFRLTIVVVVRRSFQGNSSFQANDKFCRWLEVATPLLAQLHRLGFELVVEQMETSGRGRHEIGERVTAATLFGLPENEWQKTIRERKKYTFGEGGFFVSLYFKTLFITTDGL
jgi:hypothetical protein